MNVSVGEGVVVGGMRVGVGESVGRSVGLYVAVGGTGVLVKVSVGTSVGVLLGCWVGVFVAV